MLGFIIAQLQRQPLWLQTAIIATAITIVVLIADYVLNVMLMPGVTPYTPIGTLVIVLLITPPCVYALLLQTERVRDANARLATEQQTRATLEAAHIARSRFLANTSHELRTPLNGIIGYSELLMETAEGDGRTQDAVDQARVVTMARRLLHLVNDLLDLARIDADRMALRLAEYDVRDLIEDAIGVVQPDIERNRNRVSIEIAPDLITGRSDPLRLNQCLLNLLSNAAKFTSDGEILVRAARRAEGGQDWLVLEVRDTGIGIAPDRQVVLFEPFMQAQASSDSLGAGLGLAITRQLARLMGGDVTVSSMPGAGSCFTLFTPLHAIEGELPKPNSGLIAA